MNVLLAVDGSEFTKHMLAWLAVHPEWVGPEGEHAFITVVPALPPRVARYLDHKTEEQYYTDLAEEVFAPIVAFGARHGWRMIKISAVGRASEEIVKTAEQRRCDMLVMGSHGHSSVGNLVLGSVTQRVLSTCKVPVLIVR